MFRRLFCKHEYEPMSGYVMLGWEKCKLCGKERYNDKLYTGTIFYIGKFNLK